MSPRAPAPLSPSVLPLRLPLLLPLLLAAAAATAQVGPQPAAGRPRNVVLILADDLGVECLGCYGSELATPELDRLAGRGLRFRQAHTQPLCTPTRVELLTGRSNARNYEAFSVLPRSARTFAHLLRDAGYATGVFGKWQLLAAEHYPEAIRGTGTRPAAAGFDRHCLWQVDGLGSRYWGPRLVTDGETRQHPDADFGPDVVCDALLGFVEQNADRPFLAFWPMLLTHSPFVAPPAADGARPAEAARGPGQFPKLVAHMDRLVGRVARRLEALGLAEHTLLVFVGDNGTGRNVRTRQADGELVRGGKGQPHHAGTHVPMIAWAPGLVAPGRVVDDLVCTRDLLPTLCELAGAEVEGPVDGHSLLPLLRGEPGPARDALAFWYWPRPRTRPDSRPVRFALDARFVLTEGVGLRRCRAPDRALAEPLDDDAAAAAARLQRALDALGAIERPR